ncbi:DUF6163 family protein [Chenggangzhangella methanolivorans]|uniref:DUF6163 family protein n=1 Tax=Chenggangzhangella methanolivorans TaxID=1437009 RepID=A0A9E6RF97_9HYPH|nr:DUF6163 family protein [Chenggangzhangella methanolivorans]QZO00156.1 DUF6163 family protein [Chenggangzhangella methanolivorans]
MSAEDDRSDPPPISARDQRLSADRGTRPWRWRLEVFLRVLSAAEIAKGLVHWALLIGSGGAAEPLGSVAPGWMFATVFFAVADPVAGVGLWVGAAWGVAIWLIAALGQILAVALGVEAFGGWAAAGLVFAAMATYVALSMMARREGR